jgi:hypothetical protein
MLTYPATPLQATRPCRERRGSGIASLSGPLTSRRDRLYYVPGDEIQRGSLRVDLVLGGHRRVIKRDKFVHKLTTTYIQVLP